ncbi:MAG: VTT domain-containing protein [Desulfobacteraceae bacterium]
MPPQSVASDTFSPPQSLSPLRQPLARQMVMITEKCVNCPKCTEQCDFLKQNGTPKFIAENYLPEDPGWLTLAFSCSLCGLCEAVCPVNLSPGDLFLEMRDYLTDYGVTRVIVVCPNCHKVFKAYGTPLSVTAVYGMPEMYLDKDTGKDHAGANSPAVAIHDPCVLRNEPEIQASVRQLAGSAGFTLEEMPHSGKTTLCCGEGGSAGCVNSRLAQTWGEQRKQEANNRRLLTYCAGCANFLNKKTPTDHILDAVFHPDAVTDGTRKVARAPLTYFNRTRLKRYVQKNYAAPVTRERTFTSTFARESGNSGKIKKILMLAAVIVAIAGIRVSGILDNFDAETLRHTVTSLGPLAPLAFMLLYSLAPTLFMPGLPLTIAAGIIFGPFWGVVYSITGATAGASLAFLISRYVARDWITAKLSGPRWQKLDQSVENNGWKIVAFTRLVPLFPFNLLNYAFGLTPIKFLPYAGTSFICMLPACVAFIVFSSSFIDLLKGNISPTFIIGILLIVLVSLIPKMVQKFRPAQEKDLELS